MGNGDLSKEWTGGDNQDERAGDFATDAESFKAIPSALPDSEARMARLIRTIEGEIVPRLVLSRREVKPVAAVRVRESRGPDGSDVAELVRLLLHHDVSVASAYVDTVRQRGASLEVICLDLLAPAARELGDRWEEDECDFMQVTVGLCRLHQLLRELSPEFCVDESERAGNRRILLATCPGDQHTFGIALVAQFLRRAGWDVWHEFLASNAEILEVCSQHWFSVVGLSVATDTRIDVLKETIRAIRRASRNRGVGIMVGGPILIDRPELADLVGADATAVDGQQAVTRAEQIFTSLGATH
jgi:methanogenic corrinoid protein MtbC1